MGWDRDRPVPWRRLVKEYAIYAGIAAVVLAILTQGRDYGSLLIGLVAAGPIYVGLGAVMAKFGYQRKTLAELRTPRASAGNDESGADRPSAPRSRPAPTRRTSAGRNRPNRPNRRKR
ncbi:MAG: hypothetical protein ACK5OX_18465 [Desertimonas sp.]